MSGRWYPAEDTKHISDEAGCTLQIKVASQFDCIPTQRDGLSSYCRPCARLADKVHKRERLAPPKLAVAPKKRCPT
jgi:hypothetical protein